ncbi:MAG: 1-acyl-sn-glycerol-3-phosphate acyltransferase [Actinomycetota bacterium]
MSMKEPQAAMAEVIPFARARREPGKCRAITAAGRPCRNPAGASGFCRVHEPPVAAENIGPFEAQRVRDIIRFLSRRLTGQYDVDVFGFDPELTESVFLPIIRAVYRYYWRADWNGLENVPSDGPALLVANHAGTFPLDAMVMKFGVLGEHPARRHVRLLAADLTFRMPIVSPMARKIGATLACEEDARRLLQAGELIGVFPEGFKGVGKGFRNRYRLQRFGRGGFVETALREQVPIVPVAIVGSEEAIPMVADVRPLARLFGLPYFPITPTFPWLGPLGLVPFPSKWTIEFGPPILTDVYGPDAWHDAMLLFELTDRIRDTVQQMLYQNLMTRRSAFL